MQMFKKEFVEGHLGCPFLDFGEIVEIQIAKALEAASEITGAPLWAVKIEALAQLYANADLSESPRFADVWVAAASLEAATHVQGLPDGLLFDLTCAWELASEIYAVEVEAEYSSDESWQVSGGAL